ncbi:restriction endonuclease subunit S [uncultured Prevotella sp.]|uniref:restriction endonuclease subunit S n=1 Tax=uncultured Prevotella sp. TaxID=159272 RepID=UPI0025EE4729|nr:restriction endonuclease subunit S [uncultured Prevotella sp.]
MNIPKIRFKGFEDTWKNDKIGNIGSILMCKRIFKSQTTSIGDIPFYKIGTFGSTADAFISENLFNEYKTRFSYPQYGDILLSAAGTIGRIVEYKGEKAYFQDSNIVWVKVNGKIKNQFLKYIYSCIKWNGLEGSTIKRLYNNNILETAINYPSPEEQQKIASYFQSLDSLIQITSKKLASLKQIKAASLQSMFPQEGETVPKVRFKGFKEGWEKEKLGNLFKERIENNINGELLSVTINNGIIKASDNGRFDNSNNDKSHYKVVKIGDIVYNTMRMWQGASGYSAYEGIVSPAYTVIIPQEQVFPLFFAYLFKTQSLINRFRIHSQGLTTDTWNLKFAGFSIIEVCFPKSKLEQQKIASYFCNLDKQISLQTQRLEKLKQIKAACLDKMFV